MCTIFSSHVKVMSRWIYLYLFFFILRLNSGEKLTFEIEIFMLHIIEYSKIDWTKYTFKSHYEFYIWRVNFFIITPPPYLFLNIYYNLIYNSFNLGPISN